MMEPSRWIWTRARASPLRWEEAPAAFMADYRHSEYWCRPAFGSELKQIPDETQGLLLRHGDGRFTAVLPVVSETYKCVLRGEEDGTLTARLFRGMKA